MALGDLTLSYIGRAYTFTFSGDAITPSSQVFAVDDLVFFSTTGILPTGLALNTTYYVVNADSTTISVATSEGGTPISLSEGSGTHSIRIVMSVVINKFLDATPPRESANLSGQATFSLNGNFIISGISFEDPQRYTINAKVSVNDAEKIRAMFWTADKMRRENGLAVLTLTDEIEQYFEEGKTALTKTRSSVGTPVQQNGGVYYYPRMQVFMPQEPLLGIDTSVGTRTISFELQETGVKI